MKNQAACVVQKFRPERTVSTESENEIGKACAVSSYGGRLLPEEEGEQREKRDSKRSTDKLATMRSKLRTELIQHVYNPERCAIQQALGRGVKADIVGII